MVKKVSLFCGLVFLCLFVLGAAVSTDTLCVPEYVEDGLVYDSDEIEIEKQSLQSYEDQLDEYVYVSDNQFFVDYESIEEKVDIDEEVLDQIRSNVEFANNLAQEQPEIISIEQDKTLSFNIEDEYAEQWDAWQLSWSFWKGWTYKLDSDFGKLIGISGIVYRLMSYITNGVNFYKNIMNITDKSVLASTLSTILFYLPGSGVKDFVRTYLQNNVAAIAAAIVSVNLGLIALKTATAGVGWIIFKIVDFVVGRLVPSLITSCSMVYNCYRYNSPIYCKISCWTASIQYSLTKF